MINQKLSDVLGNHSNNFNLLRFAAALTVLYGHSFPLTLGRGAADPLANLTHHRLGLGSLAVDIFFVISGFLVTGSLVSRKNIVQFCWARILRIFPALFFCNLFCVLGIGWFFTTLPASQYFQSSELRHFMIENSTLRDIVYFLPGVFQSTIYPRAVVGSIWSLPYEVKMYLALGGIWLLSRCFFRQAVAGVAGLAFVAYMFLLLQGPATSGLEKNLLNYARFGSLFALGALFHTYREKIMLNPWLFGLCLILLASITLGSSALPATLVEGIYTLTLPYAVLYFAYINWGPARRFNQFGDYSYGLYIYAFPVQQSLVASGLGTGANHLFAWSIAVTLPLAMLSWHAIERPALSLKTRLRWS